jgi:hypothetical protein
MFDEFEDEQYGIDPPHAFAMLEGQPCSCPSRYYGGDCQHTVSDDEEDRLNAVDDLIEAVVVFEVDRDDLYQALYAGAVNAARSLVEDLTADCRRVVDEAEIAGVSYIESTPSIYSVLDGLWTAGADGIDDVRADVVDRSYADEWVDALPTS